MTNYWYAGNAQEGCHFDRSSQSSFLPVMSSELRKRGLEKIIELSASDETCIASAEESLRSWTPEALSAISQVNTHTYWGPSYPRARLLEKAKEAQKRLWQSEYGAGAAPPWEMPDALSMGTQIAADLNTMGAQAWVYWQAVEDLDGKPPTPWWGLAQLSFANGGSACGRGSSSGRSRSSPRASGAGRRSWRAPGRPTPSWPCSRGRAAAGGGTASGDGPRRRDDQRRQGRGRRGPGRLLLPRRRLSSSAGTVKAWRTSSSENRADAGEIAPGRGLGREVRRQARARVHHDARRQPRLRKMFLYYCLPGERKSHAIVFIFDMP